MVGKPQRKTLLGRPRYRWKNNIKMDLIGTGCDLNLNAFDVK
jgi:hypothetical protein